MAALNQQQVSQLLTLLNALRAAQAAQFAAELVYATRTAAYSAAVSAYNAAFSANANADAVQADTETSLRSCVDDIVSEYPVPETDGVTVASFAQAVLTAHQTVNNAPADLAAAAATQAAALAAYLAAQQDLTLKENATDAAFAALQAYMAGL